MSDVEDDNLRNETRKKQSNTNMGVNVTHDHTTTKIEDNDSTEANDKKKKVIKYSVIGGGILVAIILIIVLSVTLSGGDG